MMGAVTAAINEAANNSCKITVLTGSGPFYSRLGWLDTAEECVRQNAYLAAAMI